MIPQLASIAIIGTAVWMISTDPMHKLHHAAPVTVAVVAPVKVASIQTDAQVAFAARYMRMLPAGKGVK